MVICTRRARLKKKHMLLFWAAIQQDPKTVKSAERSEERGQLTCCTISSTLFFTMMRTMHQTRVHKEHKSAVHVHKRNKNKLHQRQIDLLSFLLQPNQEMMTRLLY